MKTLKCTYWQQIDEDVITYSDGCRLTIPFYREVGSSEGRTPWENLPVGACVYAKRGLMVKLPLNIEWTDFTFFNVNSKATSGGTGWTCTGEPPNVTISPSIWFNRPTGWHGFVQNGEVRDA